MYWKTIWIILSLFFSIVSFFPLTNWTHWVFRIFDFIRLQLLVVLVILLIIRFVDVKSISFPEGMVILLILSSIVYHLVIILPYLPKDKKQQKTTNQDIVVLSINVKQTNRCYEKLISLVNKIQPDILLTMETDKKWEENLVQIENLFKNAIRVPKDNRYGMHLYTKLDLKEHQVHYLISEQHPSIKATLVDKNNNDFIFWGIHPPPPSPSEKPSSKQKDAELMKVAQYVLETEVSMVVTGDFNNVCWSKSSKLFSKISKLKDARINKGFHSTFPADFWLFRFPIDLLFHSNSVTINKIKALSSIGSDHLPLLSVFHINSLSETKDGLDSELQSISNKIIREGEVAANKEN